MRRPPPHESRAFRVVVYMLCAIAIAVSIRRLVALAGQPAAGPPPFAALDALFAAKPWLTASHVLAGLLLAMAFPVQLSSTIRNRHRRLHRRLGRGLLVVGGLVGASGYAMVAKPVGGSTEMAAIILYATAFLACLLIGWRHIRRRDESLHREWMLRASGIALGVATTRPIMAVFFATSAITHLTPPHFFGAVMWIGFTATAAAAEWYVRSTRPPELKRRLAALPPDARVQGDLA